MRLFGRPFCSHLNLLCDLIRNHQNLHYFRAKPHVILVLINYSLHECGHLLYLHNSVWNLSKYPGELWWTDIFCQWGDVILCACLWNPGIWIWQREPKQSFWNRNPSCVKFPYIISDFLPRCPHPFLSFVMKTEEFASSVPCFLYFVTW